jgi:hypothetical protein
MRQRNALLLAWYDLIEHVAAHPHDPGAARLKIDWWRQEVVNMGHGKARHPLAIKLQEAGLNDRAESLLNAILDSAEEEIRSPALRDDPAFAAACRNSLGNFFVLLTRVERESDYNADSCLGLGTYCAAVERVRRMSERPDRVPLDMKVEALRQMPSTERADRIEALFGRIASPTPTVLAQAPDLARRLSALAGAMHVKMRRKDYAVTDAPIDRAPIAHLWTAWRCC